MSSKAAQQFCTQSGSPGDISPFVVEGLRFAHWMHSVVLACLRTEHIPAEYFPDLTYNASDLSTRCFAHKHALSGGRRTLVM